SEAYSMMIQASNGFALSAESRARNCGNPRCPFRRRRASFPARRSSHDLQRDGGGLAPADADGRDAALESAVVERIDEGDEDARTGGTDGMAEGARSAVHVHLPVRQPEVV